MDFTFERIIKRSKVFDPITLGLVAGGTSLLSAGTGLLQSDAQSSAGNKANDATLAAAREAANATLTGTRESIAAQQGALNTIRGDNAVFIQPADKAMATLQSLIYGTPQTYTERSLADLGRGPQQPAYATGTSSLYGGATPQQIMEMVTGKTPNPNGYTIADALKAGQQVSTTMQGSNVNPNSGNVTGTATAQNFAFDPSKINADPAYNWEKSQGLNDLRTQLMLMGRPSGTVAANANSKFLGNLNAGYNDKFYNRNLEERNNYQNNLNNLLNLARGGTATVGAATTNAANQSSSALLNQGNNLANIATGQGQNAANNQLYQGQVQSNLYGGLSQLPGQALQSFMGLKGMKF